jgi:uncharacterized protein YbaR (Trm112 family)
LVPTPRLKGGRVGLGFSAPGAMARSFFTAGGSVMSFDERLLEILVCPKCKGDLEHRSEGSSLVCRACKLAYPIRDDIPVMLEGEAERVDS